MRQGDRIDRILDGAAAGAVWFAVLMIAAQILRGFCFGS